MEYNFLNEAIDGKCHNLQKSFYEFIFTLALIISEILTFQIFYFTK